MDRKDARMLARHGQLPNKPRAAVERVDPPTAAAWLETSRGNRRISQEHVTRLADQMKAGHWQLTHQGVAFDCDGSLIDGHHTLWAILMSGVTVDLMVTRNLRREAMRVIDTGKNRTLQDRLTLCRTWGSVSRAEATCLKRMVRARATTMKRSPEDEYQDWKANVAHVRLAMSLTDGLGRGLKLGTIRAVIARAHRTVDAETLHRWCWHLKNDRTLLDGLRGKADTDTYEIVERALWSFAHGGSEMRQGEGF